MGTTLMDLSSLLRSNKAFARLVFRYKNGHLTVVPNISDNFNSPRSLPITHFPKEQIFRTVQNDNSIGKFRKPLVSWFRFGLEVMKNYRNGMTSTYRTYRDSRAVADLVPPIAQICKDIQISGIHTRKNVAPVPLAFTRTQFIERHRRSQVWKLPTFFLIALMFEETTPLVCYFLPEIVPYNCLTPGGFRKMIKNNHSSVSAASDSKYLSPYSVPDERLFELLKSKAGRMFASRWAVTISKLSKNRTVPAELLVKVHQYLFIDDFMLVTGILTSEIKLSHKEVVNCIVERNLYLPEEDLNQLVLSKNGRDLLMLRLILYWAHRFNETAIVDPANGTLYSQKWGINNVNLMFHPGTTDRTLLKTEDIQKLID